MYKGLQRPKILYKTCLSFAKKSVNTKTAIQTCKNETKQLNVFMKKKYIMVGANPKGLINYCTHFMSANVENFSSLIMSALQQ